MPQQVLAAAVEVELAVKGGYAVELGEGDQGTVGDVSEGGSGKVSQEVLGALQDGDERARPLYILGLLETLRVEIFFFFFFGQVRGFPPPKPQSLS